LSRRFARLLLATAACAFSCSAESRPTPASGTLPPGIAARVGGDLIETATIARIANARGVDGSHARDLAIKDALFAAAARTNPDRAADVSVAERAILGRTLLETLRRRSENAGPPTDAEVSEMTAERWMDVDRPSSVRTTHAIVLVKSPNDAARARGVADELASALRGITDSAEFIERAQAMPTKSLEIRAERLSPVTADGRVWDPTAPPGTRFTTFDLDYARAANALREPGAHSPVTRSAFGFHVILLEERFPELRTSLEERRERFKAEIVARRGKKLLEGTVAELRRGTPVEVVRAADSLTALVAP
jgi:hypothetical protein